MSINSVKATALTLTLSALVLGCVKKPGHIKSGDFRIVQNDNLRKINRRELKSLEEILETPSKEEEVFAGQKFNLNPPQYPQVVYHLDKKSSKARGTALIVHKEGFFISVHHAFDDFLNGRRNGETDKMMMVYDSTHGFAFPARVLAFSPEDKYDVLLGKIDIKGDFSIKTVKIHDTDKPLGGYAYALTHRNRTYLNEYLFKEITSVCTFFQGDPYFTFQQKSLLKRSKSIGFEVLLGGSVYISLPNGKNALKPWEASFRAAIKPGDSGSPVFDLKNRYIGVITSYRTDIKNAGIYAKSSPIVKMVKTYLKHHKTF